MKSCPHSTKFEFTFLFVSEVWGIENSVYAVFIGGIINETTPLLPPTHDDRELHGKLSKLYVEHWIGENYLMSEHGQWSKIISLNERALGYGISLAFSSICNEHHSMIPDYETTYFQVMYCITILTLLNLR